MPEPMQLIDPGALDRQIALFAPVVGHLRAATLPEVSPTEWDGLAARTWRERAREVRASLAVAADTAEALLARMRLLAGQRP
jgi:hypothetical protein